EPETRGQCFLYAIVAGRRGKRREVALEGCGSRDEGGVLHAVGSQRGPLIAAEEEQLIFHDRSADNSAELIPLQGIPLESEGVAGVQLSVPQKFERIAVKLIAARFGHGIDGRSRVEPVL